jgi:hypothetical protein
MGKAFATLTLPASLCHCCWFLHSKCSTPPTPPTPRHHIQYSQQSSTLLRKSLLLVYEYLRIFGSSSNVYPYSSTIPGTPIAVKPMSDSLEAPRTKDPARTKGRKTSSEPLQHLDGAPYSALVCRSGGPCAMVLLWSPYSKSQNCSP